MNKIHASCVLMLLAVACLVASPATAQTSCDPDTESPVIGDNPDIVQQSDANVCSGTVLYENPSASDNCPNIGAVSCSPASGSTFPVGTTTVTCAVEDASGNTATSTFTVTVVDTEPPVIGDNPDVVLQSGPNCGSTLFYSTPSASDDCSNVITVSCDVPSGAVFPVGTTTVTCTATDASGNTATSTFTVTVVDTIPPQITCPFNITTDADSGVCTASEAFAAEATDNCPTTLVYRIGDTVITSPHAFPEGVSTVAATATDTSGNTATCTFTVTVAPTCVPECEFCEPTTGACTPVPSPPAQCDEICRTPGFWGTHGGTEKEGHSTNITLALLNAYNAANVGNELTICGTPITNTDECSVSSALEAICVSPKGAGELQLGRQLTAAALNCIITKATDADTGACVFDAAGLTGAVCASVSIGPVFEACNAACPSTSAFVDLDNDPATPDVEVSCIGALDCFNNGGSVEQTDSTWTCEDVEGETCHDRELCADFQPPGATGSPAECNDSRKNCVTIFGATDQCDDPCVP
jgi:hypothetical protein